MVHSVATKSFVEECIARISAPKLLSIAFYPGNFFEALINRLWAKILWSTCYQHLCFREQNFHVLDQIQFSKPKTHFEISLRAQCLSFFTTSAISTSLQIQGRLWSSTQFCNDFLNKIISLEHWHAWMSTFWKAFYVFGPVLFSLASCEAFVFMRI